MPTIEDQLARYGTHLGDLDDEGSLAVPTPTHGTRSGRTIAFAACLLLFVAAAAAIAWRANQTSSPVVDLPPATAPGQPVEVYTVSDTGGEVCDDTGLCVRLTALANDGVVTPRWTVTVSDGQTGYGSVTWSPCDIYPGLSLAGFTDDTLRNGVWGIVPADTPQLAVDQGRVRQIAIAAGTDTISVIAVTGAGPDAVHEAVKPYLPTGDIPALCLSQFQDEMPQN